jgi:beta-glucanase (GH16 family)
VAAVVAQWAQPLSGAVASGTVQFRVVGKAFNNVEIFRDSVMLTRCVVSADRTSATANIDTAQFANGSVTLTAHAWDSAAGQPFSSDADAGPLTFTVSNATSGTANPVGWNRLIWSDEFDGATGSKPNGSKWIVRNADSNGQNGWLNYFCPDDVYLDSGSLVLRGRKGVNCSNGYHDYTAGYVSTGDIGHGAALFSFTYGRVDIRAKIPKGQGIWPALWTCNVNSWPPEFDILDNGMPYSQYSDGHHVFQNSIMTQADGSTDGESFLTDIGVDISQGYHIYSMEWEAQVVRFYIDGKLTGTSTRNVTNASAFLIFDLQIGGSWPGNPDGSTAFPAFMYIDYVRVYQR